jgi:hypothetical protein
MRVTVPNDKGASPGQGRRLCLKLTAPTDVGANGLLLPVDAGMSGYKPNPVSGQGGRSVAFVVARATEAI